MEAVDSMPLLSYVSGTTGVDDSATQSVDNGGNGKGRGPKLQYTPRKNIVGHMRRKTAHESQTRVSQVKFLLVLLVLKFTV